jgi:hydroxymethylglutaryl-CoA reductase
MTISERREIVAEKIVDSTVNFNQLDEGGLTLEHADSMIENVIGKLSLPIAVIPMLPINKKKYMVPVSL